MYHPFKSTLPIKIKVKVVRLGSRFVVWVAKRSKAKLVLYFLSVLEVSIGMILGTSLSSYDSAFSAMLLVRYHNCFMIYPVSHIGPYINKYVAYACLC